MSTLDVILDTLAIPFKLIIGILELIIMATILAGGIGLISFVASGTALFIYHFVILGEHSYTALASMTDFIIVGVTTISVIAFLIKEYRKELQV